ncbi:tRNA lysidine(34) synthetase TilS [Acidobacterium sp. S8]|uniref:tRNA lysidine(34) synthetase TilS n=1 Tax=Acidobacterium sp. S8 TaxID=1641854 RepID=UPI0020B1568B|nr:tRNA lysidine(34) synthetase TilS [Acidobacterium sp. S8]
MPSSKQNSLPLMTRLFRPGMRLGVAVSGGADSVALLKSLYVRRQELGLVLTVLHVHHGIRGEEADGDAAFVAALAGELGLRFLRRDVDTPARAEQEAETMEEAARKLRYAWFESLLAARELDAVATAHTLDDQAETVLQKMLRGTWTEGLAGIFPIVERPGGEILRPLLETRRGQIEEYLQALKQPWREDATNRDTAYNRNRIRHELLPILAKYNPRITSQLGHLADIARDEDAYWQMELARILPSLLLPGRSVRGGGRASSTHPEEASVGIEVERLRTLHPALRRRILRAAAEQTGCVLNFEQTELLMAMCEGKAGRRETLTAEVKVERTPRELRILRERNAEFAQATELRVPVPGRVEADGFGLRMTTEANIAAAALPSAILRFPKAGDRVRLCYTAAPKRIKEVLERMQIAPRERKSWPVLEWQGEIVWMQGAEIESPAASAAGLKILAEKMPPAGGQEISSDEVPGVE